MEWLELCDRKVIWRHEEPGVNPLTMGMQPLKDTFKRVLTLMPEAPVAVGYYGAGCTPKVCNELEKSFSNVLVAGVSVAAICCWQPDCSVRMARDWFASLAQVPTQACLPTEN